MVIVLLSWPNVFSWLKIISPLNVGNNPIAQIESVKVVLGDISIIKEIFLSSVNWYVSHPRLHNLLQSTRS